MSALDMSVSQACWQACGQPTCHDCAGGDDEAPAARCARCGAATTCTIRTTTVVSRRFTAWDGWHDLSGRWVCSACAWLFTTAELRSTIREVTSEPSTRELGPSQLHEVLATGVDSSTAVIVPLRPGRKHLLAQAQWGCVCVDDATLPWTEECADRLAAMTRLREWGFSVAELAGHAPTYSVIIAINPGLWPQIMSDWARVDPWRQTGSLYWQVALRASAPSTSVA